MKGSIAVRFEVCIPTAPVTARFLLGLCWFEVSDNGSSNTPLISHCRCLAGIDDFVRRIHVVTGEVCFSDQIKSILDDYIIEVRDSKHQE